MKKVLITILTIFLAFLTSYYTTDAHKKQNLFDIGNSNLIYKLQCLFTGETDTTDAKSIYIRATQRIDYQEYELAIKDLDKALKLDSNFIYSEGIYSDYYTYYLQAQDTLKAIEFLKNFISKDQYNYDSYNKIADVYIQLHDFKSAELYLQNSIRINSDYNADAFSKLSKIKYKYEKYEEALNLINKAIAINNYYTDYYDIRRLIYIKLNKLDLAKADYDYIISQDYNYFPDYYEKGKGEENKKNYQGAIENYKLALSISKIDRNILEKRAWAYISIKQYDSACFDFDTVAKYYPDRTSFFNKAYAEDYLDKIEEAIADYSTSIGYDSTYYLSFMNRGYEYYRLKKYENAEKDYTKSINSKSDYYLHYYNRGLLYFELKKYLAAIFDYQKALLYSPGNSDITYDIALAYDKLENKKSTIEYFNKYLKIAPVKEYKRKEYAGKRIEELSK
ncbi:MAG: tetratricopeptide repeat protein [Bacteroidales bacterium]|nr:tetratricopeptide repeat protein [Bacteroidales bacterium]